MYDRRTYTPVYTDDITYMCNLNPVKWVTAEDRKKYILLDFVESPDIY